MLKNRDYMHAVDVNSTIFQNLDGHTDPILPASFVNICKAAPTKRLLQGKLCFWEHPFTHSEMTQILDGGLSLRRVQTQPMFLSMSHRRYSRALSKTSDNDVGIKKRKKE